MSQSAPVDIQKLLDSAPGTEFEKRVWRELLSIPHGKTLTYRELAKRVGRPKAARAVGNAVGKNPYPVRVPCHRVVRGDGAPGGYSGPGGTRAKERLLRREKAKR